MYAIRIGLQRIVVLSDRSAIDRILREGPERFRRTRQLESAATKMRLRGVFAAEGDDWRRQRGIVVTGSMPAWMSSSLVLRTHIEAIDFEKFAMSWCWSSFTIPLPFTPLATTELPLAMPVA